MSPADSPRLRCLKKRLSREAGYLGWPGNYGGLQRQRLFSSDLHGVIERFGTAAIERAQIEAEHQAEKSSCPCPRLGATGLTFFDEDGRSFLRMPRQERDV